MKRSYSHPIMDIITFTEEDDIITTSMTAVEKAKAGIKEKAASETITIQSIIILEK